MLSYLCGIINHQSNHPNIMNATTTRRTASNAAIMPRGINPQHDHESVLAAGQVCGYFLQVRDVIASGDQSIVQLYLYNGEMLTAIVSISRYADLEGEISVVIPTYFDAKYDNDYRTKRGSVAMLPAHLVLALRKIADELPTGILAPSDADRASALEWAEENMCREALLFNKMVEQRANELATKNFRQNILDYVKSCIS